MDLYDSTLNNSEKHFIASGNMVVSGVNYPIFCYKIDEKLKNYPLEGGIYAISGIYDGNDGKMLVGKTNQENGLGARWLQHRTDLRNNNHCNYYIQNSVNKHGLDNFVFWQLETGVSPEDLGKREGFWSEVFQSHYTRNGWNIQEITDDGGFHLSEETRERLRQINLGHTHTEETRKKMSISRSGEKNCNWGKKGVLNPLYGRKLSKEHIRKAVETKMANGGWWNLGKKMSKEYKEKCSLASKKRKILKFINPNGEEVIFQSIRAANRFGLYKTNTLKEAQESLNKTINGWTLIEIVNNNV